MLQSKILYQKACDLLPAGVSSPVRAFRSVGGDPVFMTRGEGSLMFDVDGNSYLDFCNSWGPLILGHGHPRVRQAIHEVVDRGWTFGTPIEDEVRLASLLVEKLDPVDMVRFVNSGTEAVMSAVRLARGYTRRDAMLKFSGCYHGHADYLLVEGGSGLVTFGKPSSDGVPSAFTELTCTLPLDDDAALETLFQSRGDDLACALIEGVPANNGLLIQRPDFLRHLRELCDRHGVLLIFDEVLTGFRLPEIMAYSHYGIRPDIITLGKVLGGGMPVGAYAASREIMSCVAPLGGVYQAGTLSGNPVAMAAGLATLNVYYEERAWDKLDSLGAYLDQALEGVLASCESLGMCRLGSLFWFYFHAQEAPRRAERIHRDSARDYARLHAFLLSEGLYLAPSAFEVGFLNTAMTQGDMDRLAQALELAVSKGVLK